MAITITRLTPALRTAISGRVIFITASSWVWARGPTGVIGTDGVAIASAMLVEAATGRMTVATGHMTVAIDRTTVAIGPEIMADIALMAGAGMMAGVGMVARVRMMAGIATVVDLATVGIATAGDSIQR